MPFYTTLGRSYVIQAGESSPRKEVILPKAASSSSGLSSLVTSPGSPPPLHCLAIHGHEQPWLTQIKAPGWVQVGG